MASALQKYLRSEYSHSVHGGVSSLMAVVSSPAHQHAPQECTAVPGPSLGTIPHTAGPSSTVHCRPPWQCSATELWQALTLYQAFLRRGLPGTYRGGGGRKQKKVCVPNIDLQVRGPFDKLHFFSGPFDKLLFLRNVCGWVGQAKSLGGGGGAPPVSLRKDLVWSAGGMRLERAWKGIAGEVTGRVKEGTMEQGVRRGLLCMPCLTPRPVRAVEGAGQLQLHAAVRPRAGDAALVPPLAVQVPELHGRPERGRAAAPPRQHPGGKEGWLRHPFGGRHDQQGRGKGVTGPASPPPPPLSLSLSESLSQIAFSRNPQLSHSQCGVLHNLGDAQGQGCIRREGTPEAAQKRLDRRLEEVAKSVGGRYCQLQMPSKRALGIRGTEARRRLGALEAVATSS